MAGAITEMPEHLRKTFFEFVHLSFDDDIIINMNVDPMNVDPESQTRSLEDVPNDGKSCHFELWFRYGTSVSFLNSKPIARF